MTDDSKSASPYAGRWVAKVRGRIVAQGGTPEQALHAAQISRHKEKPEIVYMPNSFSHSPIIDKVREILPEQEIHLVGGAVRDMLLNRVSSGPRFCPALERHFLRPKSCQQTQS